MGISSKENTESDIFCFELKSRNSNFFPGIAAAHAWLRTFFSLGKLVVNPQNTVFTQCGNDTHLLSHFFDKNFVKATSLFDKEVDLVELIQEIFFR